MSRCHATCDWGYCVIVAYINTLRWRFVENTLRGLTFAMSILVEPILQAPHDEGIVNNPSTNYAADPIYLACSFPARKYCGTCKKSLFKNEDTFVYEKIAIACGAPHVNEIIDLCTLDCSTCKKTVTGDNTCMYPTCLETQHTVLPKKVSGYYCNRHMLPLSYCRYPNCNNERRSVLSSYCLGHQYKLGYRCDMCHTNGRKVQKLGFRQPQKTVAAGRRVDQPDLVLSTRCG